jgi:hypothetical protein
MPDDKKYDFAIVEHHETVRKKLSEAIDRKDLSKEKADEIWDAWLRKREEAKRRRKKGL